MGYKGPQFKSVLLDEITKEPADRGPSYLDEIQPIQAAAEYAKLFKQLGKERRFEEQAHSRLNWFLFLNDIRPVHVKARALQTYMNIVNN